MGEGDKGNSSSISLGIEELLTCHSFSRMAKRKVVKVVHYECFILPMLTA